MNSLKFGFLSLVVMSGVSFLVHAEDKKICPIGEQCSIAVPAKRICKPLQFCPDLTVPGVCDADGVCRRARTNCTFYDSETHWFSRMVGLGKKTGTVQIKQGPDGKPQLYCTDKVAPMEVKPERFPSYPLGIKK